MPVTVWVRTSVREWPPQPSVPELDTSVQQENVRMCSHSCERQKNLLSLNQCGKRTDPLSPV